MQPIKFVFLPLLTSLLLTSCGFHLRGLKQISSRLEPVIIVHSAPAAAPNFLPILTQELKNNNITITEIRSNASSELEILSLQQKKQQISLSGSPQSGEYQLNLQVEMRLIDSTGKVILPTVSLSTDRYYSEQITQMLSTNQQVEQLQEAMSHELANQMIQHLNELE